jgi:hypothetical protein
LIAQAGNVVDVVYESVGHVLLASSAPPVLTLTFPADPVNVNAALSTAVVNVADVALDVIAR